MLEHVIEIEGRRTNWKLVGICWKNMEGHGRSWKIMETGRMFGLCDHLSSCMTWKCLETSGILSFSLVSAQYLVYIRAHRPHTRKNNANYLVYSNTLHATSKHQLECPRHWDKRLLTDWRNPGRLIWSCARLWSALDPLVTFWWASDLDDWFIAALEKLLLQWSTCRRRALSALSFLLQGRGTRDVLRIRRHVEYFFFHQKIRTPVLSLILIYIFRLPYRASKSCASIFVIGTSSMRVNLSSSWTYNKKRSCDQAFECK